MVLLASCPETDNQLPGVVPPGEEFYVGARGCSSCHANFAALHFRTGHSQALKPVLSEPPKYPSGAPGIPAPPPGFAWTDIAYVIGGYDLAARFIDTSGFVLTGPTAQYNVAIPAIELPAGFVPFMPARAEPLPFEFQDFRRLTTGPFSFDENGGLREENRPGIGGTWAEPGVQCEACHGPGSEHVPDPTAGNILLDANSASCARCHTRENPAVVSASGGLIDGFQQSSELAHSPHAGFACNVCHNPHASPEFDPDQAIVNQCQACHPQMDLALHQGFVYQQGDYVEPVTCMSCHMPYVVRTRVDNVIQLADGQAALFGDTQSHVFNLNPSTSSLETMFTPDGTALALDEEGWASISTCYVCRRCHNGLGNAFAFPPDEGCAFGTDIHAVPP